MGLEFMTPLLERFPKELISLMKDRETTLAFFFLRGLLIFSRQISAFDARKRKLSPGEWSQTGLQDRRCRLGRCEEADQSTGRFRLPDRTGERPREGESGL
jgi:hypothetical protein